jgi:Zn-dependent M28 family amino/carboxypeptidase
MKNRRRHIGANNKRRKVVLSSKEDSVLLDSAKIASSKAIRSSMALGLTIKVIRNHEIIAVNPDRSIRFIRKISKPLIDISSLRKGMILERK